MVRLFSDRLLADAPACREMNLFGQFVGSWDIDVNWYKRGRVARQERGEWHFSWVLACRAVQDVWIVPTIEEQARGAGVYEYGSSIRVPDKSGEFWYSTWHGPVRGLVESFIARQQQDEIVLSVDQATGGAMRWIFSDITQTRFRWRNEQMDTAGAHVCVQDLFAARRS